MTTRQVFLRRTLRYAGAMIALAIVMAVLSQSTPKGSIADYTERAAVMATLLGFLTYRCLTPCLQCGTAMGWQGFTKSLPESASCRKCGTNFSKDVPGSPYA